MRTAVFAGTFDPITKGHEYVINKALESFDKIIVVVADNTAKTPTFSSEERLEFIKRVFNGNDRVDATIHHGLMMDFMKQNSLTHYVRGIRNNTDLSYEKKMLDFNKSVYPELSTVFIYSPEKYNKINSTAVRQATSISEIENSISPLILLDVLKKLKN